MRMKSREGLKSLDVPGFDLRFNGLEALIKIGPYPYIKLFLLISIGESSFKI